MASLFFIEEKSVIIFQQDHSNGIIIPHINCTYIHKLSNCLLAEINFHNVKFIFILLYMHDNTNVYNYIML